MKVLSVIPIAYYDKSLAYLLSKGQRSEVLYDKPRFIVKLQLDHPFQFFCRRYWEANHFHLLASDLSRFDTEQQVMKLSLTLSEAIDFIYNTTPAHLKKDVPDNIKTINQIRDLLITLLIDDTIGRQEFYHSNFIALTMMDFKKQPGFDTKAIQKIRQNVQSDLIMHIIYNQNMDEFPNYYAGFYMFNGYNKTHLNELLNILSLTKHYCIHDAYKDDEGYYNITIQFYDGTYEVDDTNELDDSNFITPAIKQSFLNKMQQIKDHSYNWMTK